jgi:hypothetical protein
MRDEGLMPALDDLLEQLQQMHKIHLQPGQLPMSAAAAAEVAAAAVPDMAAGYVGNRQRAELCNLCATWASSRAAAAAAAGSGSGSGSGSDAMPAKFLLAVLCSRQHRPHF